MKRILIFSTAYFPHVGGAEVAIREITDRLGSEFECTLICARYDASLPRKERIGAVSVHRVGFGIRLLDKILSPFWGAFLARTLAQEKPFDLYWAMMATYGSGGAYIANALSAVKVPIVLTLQEGDPPSYIRTKWFGLVGLSWRLALKRSTAVTVISTYLGSLAKEFGYQGEAVLIPNGVDAARFGARGAEEERTLERSKFGKNADGTLLVTTSRLVHKNACDDVIRALALLPERVSFVVYGVGPDEEMLRALARREGVADRVLFMGQIAQDVMPAALHACDIFIRPSRSEGMGNSFIEAMAAGLPVIATQEGGIADFLFDAKRNPEKEPTGWAVAADAPEQIAAAVQDILANPEQVRLVTARAKRMASEEYEWNGIAERMQAVFERASSAVK
jgi:glycosyltransferase involved in cell wall biosynthesis